MTSPHAPESSWWSDRWAWRGALAAAPAGALLAIVYALVVVRAPFGTALLAYALGATVSAGVGCLLGGPLGAVAQGLAAWRGRPPQEDPAPVLELDPEVPRHAAAA